MKNLKKTIGAALLLLSFSACISNYSINMIHSEGVTSDVVDESDTATPSTSLTVPVSAIP